MGKRRKTREQRDQLLSNLREGMTIEAACAQSNISKSTFYEWLKKSGEDGEWTKEIDAAITFSEAVILDKIKRASELKEDWRGWAWILERRFPQRWGAKREVEVNVNNPHQQSDEMFAAMVEQSNQAYARGLTHTGEEDSDDEGTSEA
tara:strand:+ start:72 stop:515 length:444 start_codon:yes stop_codon:yes gene_type:complete